MKRTFLCGAALLAATFLVPSCDLLTNSDTKKTEDEPVATLPAAPAPNPAYDSEARGIYKGVMAESDVTGSFWIQVADEVARAVAPSLQAELNVKLNNRSVFRATAEAFEDLGVFSFNFSGTAEGSPWTFTFIVNSLGEILNSDLYVDESLIKVAVEKELSESRIETWEGTIRGSASGITEGVSWTATTTGTWNFLRQGADLWGAYGAKSVTTWFGGGETNYDSGTFAATVYGTSIGGFTGTNMPDTCTGTFSGNSVSGTWDWDDPEDPDVPDKGSGTWSGSRTQ